MKFIVILEPEEIGYSIHCPSLPGCVSQGDSREEAVANIREAIEGIQRLYETIGILDQGADLYEMQLSLYSEGVLGYYDDEDEKFYVRFVRPPMLTARAQSLGEMFRVAKQNVYPGLFAVGFHAILILLLSLLATTSDIAVESQDEQFAKIAIKELELEPPEEQPPEEAELPPEEIPTPGCDTIAALAEFLGIPAARTLKMVFYSVENIRAKLGWAAMFTAKVYKLERFLEMVLQMILIKKITEYLKLEKIGNFFNRVLVEID